MRLLVAIWKVLFLVEMVRGPFFQFPCTAAAAAINRQRSPARAVAAAGRSRRTSPYKIAHDKHSLEEELSQLNSSPTDYWWQTLVDDPKRGFSQGRTEFRRGSTVIGQYQYSDGHVRIRVVYKADQNGFRVLKEERTPLKPVVDDQLSDNSILRIRRRNSIKRKSVPVKTLRR